MKTTSDLLHRLKLAYIAPARRALSSAWSWWTTELIQMMPESLRALLGQPDRPMLLEPEDEHLVVRRSGERRSDGDRIPFSDLADHGRERPDPTFAHIDGGILVVPPTQCLLKRIDLPAAAEENLRGVLEFEMDRETPFSAEQVYFDATIAGRSRRSKTIDVDLVVTPREYLDGLLRRLAQLGLTPSAATARRGDGELLDVNLLPGERRHIRRAVISALNVRLAAAAGVLLFTAILVPIYQKHAIITELTPRVAAAREAALEGSRIRDNIERLHTAAQSLVNRKSTEPLILELLDETTRIMPDGTWLTQFAVDGDVLHLNGESAIAASLIELLDQSASFTNPQFSAPVTRTRSSDRERFDLSTNWHSGEGSWKP